MSERALNIALLAHSTNPRGGVVHAIELGDALQAAGHAVTLHAPDAGGRGLFRATACAFSPVTATALAAGADLETLVRQRIDDYIAWFERPETPHFDIYHAQDSISANALATLAERGAIPGFVRTVHHLDQFDDAQLTAWQTRGFMRADRVLCVSRLWRAGLAADYGVQASVVGNGVDTARFTPDPDENDKALRLKYGLRTSADNAGAPVFLAVGGIEPRKNTLGILQAFIRILRVFPTAQLIVAGGASLLDHGDYQRQFHAQLQQSGIETGPGKSLVFIDRVEDAQMPALFRSADALVFASLREGFGLVVLEAMACGTPAVVSRIAPFTEYLKGGDCAWADPLEPASIAAGMAHACGIGVRQALRSAGFAAAARHTWAQSAAQHLAVYYEYLASRSYPFADADARLMSLSAAASRAQSQSLSNPQFQSEKPHA
ncbi:MSMEG_0565 family glycosyltransferase [Oxalobacteraceae bacterium CAVE-383]|nr:MSMEG_0565 family glycosyltransferase [Oxalobacteraceae bacterium CAVE-383]